MKLCTYTAGGPAGCICTLYTSNTGLSTVVLKKNPSSGALAITSHIINHPGVDWTMPGADFLNMKRIQVEQYGTLYERAQVFIIDVTEATT